MNQEREPAIDHRTALTIALNLIMEGGIRGDLSAQSPGVKEILEGLEGITSDQLKDVLQYLNKNGRYQRK